MHQLESKKLKRIVKNFTQGEKIVYKYLLTFMSITDIAKLLETRVETIKTHSTNIYKKFGIQRTEVVNPRLSLYSLCLKPKIKKGLDAPLVPFFDYKDVPGEEK